MALIRFLSILLVVVCVVFGVALGASALSSGVSASQSGPCNLSQILPWEVLQWCDVITRVGHDNDLSPNLVAAIILVESGGDHEARSVSGAIGLMQVMPRDGKAAEFICENGPCFADRPTTEQLKDPEKNIVVGVRILKGCLQRSNGNLREALKAYGPVDYGYKYADDVLAIYKRLGN